MFLPFEFSLNFFFIAQRNSKAEGTAQREKDMRVEVAISMGWGPATCTVLQGGCLAGTINKGISLPLLLMQEIHITCDHLSLLPEIMSFCLASSKTAQFFSVPLSEGIVYSK